MRPTGRLLVLLGMGCALSLLAAILPRTLPLWLGFGGLVAILLLGEALVLWRTRPPTARRHLHQALSVGNPHPVTLRLQSRSRRRLRLLVHDHPPASFQVEGLPLLANLPAGGWLEIPYRVRPQRRGALSFGPADLLLTGPLGLLHRRARVGETQEIKVYPDFRAVSKYALLALDNRLSQLGVHLRRRRGQGTEFFQLREYRQGDLLRDVDWKAVSRRRQLISREYREERNQQLIFLLDCGRRMHARDGALSHFDHALNALLLLSYVALRQGDAVGLMTFSGPHRWLPPVKGARGMTTILNTVFDLHSGLAPTDYAEAAHRLALHQRRRSLVVLISNLRDDDAEALPQAIAPLRRKHLLLFSSLREPVLRRALRQPITRFQDALRVGATHHYLEQRQKVHDQVRGLGVMALDSEPAELPVALVNRYLEVKRAGLL